jgi:hypothetical protein
VKSAGSHLKFKRTHHEAGSKQRFWLLPASCRFVVWLILLPWWQTLHVPPVLTPWHVSFENSDLTGNASIGANKGRLQPQPQTWTAADNYAVKVCDRPNRRQPLTCNMQPNAKPWV